MEIEGIKTQWRGNWISYPYDYFDMSKGIPAPYFRKSFAVEKKVKRAVVKICGLGYHELHLNGQKVGEDVLNPPYTRFDTSCLYCIYDITESLLKGQNVVGVILGNGMYNVFTKNIWETEKSIWRHHPKLILQLDITYENGDTLLIETDETWKTSFGPILRDNMYEGELYDARLEMPNWNTACFDDGKWKQASVCRGPGGILKPMEMESCRVVERIAPKDYWEVRPGVWVYDMGVNMAGWVKLMVSGNAGTAVTMKFAEKLKDDRDIDQSNLDTYIETDSFQTDIYITKGEGQESWEPRFTYHGFQYVQVTGFPGTPSLCSVEGCIVNTAMESGGDFECSNEMLNKIQAACRRSTLSNYHGIPTDCPHREKIGWTGDAVLSAEQVLLNFKPQRAYRKWLNDIADCQRPNGQLPGIVPTGGWGYNWGSGPAWDSALVMIPWYMYVYLGDKTILLEMYDYMKKYADYMTSMSSQYIVGFGLGDWNPPYGKSIDHKCPLKVTDTAMYYMNCKVISSTAQILGYREDEKYYGELKDKIYQAFNKEFICEESGEVAGNCQTSYACALYYGFVEGEVKEKVINNLIREIEKCNYHIDCGILGCKYIMNVLPEIGKADLAYKIATQTTFPGWGYWIEQGATTLWETWNGDSSRNHHMFSDVSSWFYKGLAGIHPDSEEPGFKHIIIKPCPVPGLDWVKAGHESPHGFIQCNWRKEGEKLFILEVGIPENCHATIYLPGGYQKHITDIMFEGDDVKNIEFSGCSNGYSVFKVKAGTARLVSEL